MESTWLSFGFEKTCDKCTFILYRVTQIKIKHFWPHVGKAKMSLRHNKQTAGKGKIDFSLVFSKSKRVE